MSWAGRRRAVIIAIVGAVLISALAILSFSIFYETPTCTDRKENQDERGVDCGGSCSRLCAFQVASPATARFTRVLTPQPGRTDVVAYIDNPNSNAEARSAPFLLEVFDQSRMLIAKKTIKIDLPASMSVPVYLPDVAPRGSNATQAFLTPAEESFVWMKAGERPVLPTVENISITEGEAPRVTATLVNPLARTEYETTLVATVFDANGTVIAGSQTLVPTLPSQGTASLIFTWNAPWSASAARVEILPVPEL